MNLHHRSKKMVAVLLALAIVLSGTNFIFPLENARFVEFGQEVKAATTMYREIRCQNSYVIQVDPYGNIHNITLDYSTINPICDTIYDFKTGEVLRYATITPSDMLEDNYNNCLGYYNISTELTLVLYKFSPEVKYKIYSFDYNTKTYKITKQGVFLQSVPNSVTNIDIRSINNNVGIVMRDSQKCPRDSSGVVSNTYYKIGSNGEIAKVTLPTPLTIYEPSDYYAAIPIEDRPGYPVLAAVFDAPGNVNVTTVNNYKYYIMNFYAFVSINGAPTITSSGQGNEILSEADTGYIPQVSVSDPDNDTLTCKYYIDSETTPRDTKTVANTTAAQIVSFNSLNIGTLAEGNHTFKYEVSDGKITTPLTQSVNFKVDKSIPILGSVSRQSTINTISISGSATDGIAGLDANPYNYTIGSEVSGWISSGAYTSKNSLLPNTMYLTKFEARDTKGHIASSLQNIYTKSLMPSLSVSNASSYTLDVTTTDNNPSYTQYQISINNGSQYVTQEGNLTAAPAWITLSSKKVTVKGLTPNSTYTFSAKARNGDNIETPVGAAATGTTLVAPPGSPANIIATATDKTITVSWDAVNGAVGYDIEADGMTINNGTSTTYTNRSLNPGTPHKYRVRAKNAGGPGNWSVETSKSTLPASPNIPQNLNTIPLSTSVTVTWNNVPGATGYDIEVDGVLVNNGPATSYIHNSLTPGTHHSYRVRSINPGGKSEWSSYVNTTTSIDSIQVPVNITATPSLNKIALSWDPVEGASGYDIQVDEQTFDNSNRTTYTHSNLIPGTQHIYKVRAKKGSKNSEWSSIVVSSTLTNTFGTPANFKANADDTSVTLTWDAVPEAEGYDVEIDGVITDNAMETSCIHKGLIPDSSHTYKVRARKAANSSDWTQPLTVKTYKLQTPQNIMAVSDETSITINWNPVNGATSYDIEIDGSIVSGIAGIQSLQTTTNSAITTTGQVISTATFTTDSAITAAENQVLPATYTITGLTPNTQHTIKVRAVNENETSGWSTPLTQSTRIITGNTPNLSGLAKKSSITVMWNAMDGASAYEVEADGEVTTNVTGTTFNSTGLAPGTQHSYRVRAQNGSGAGDWSSPFTVSTLPEGPATPTNFAASGNMTSILVTWDKVAGAEEYEIEADGVVINTGTGTSYLHTGLTPDTSHKYRVRAKNISSFSEWSETKSVNTLSSVQTYQIESTSGEEFDLVLTANNIQDLDKYTFTIQYNTDDFEVIDLCGLTAKTDTVEGDISGTDITVKQLVPGTIVFTKTGSAQSWQVWSGVVNSITFKGKKDGKSTITYTIQ